MKYGAEGRRERKCFEKEARTNPVGSRGQMVRGF